MLRRLNAVLFAATLALLVVANAHAMTTTEADGRPLAEQATAYAGWLRTTELSSILTVVGAYDVGPRAPRYLLHLAVPTSRADSDVAARTLWTGFRKSSTAVGIDVERRVLVKFAHLLDVPASDVIVVITGPQSCWRVQLVVDNHGFRTSDRDCGSGGAPPPNDADALRNLSRRIGARMVRPSDVLVADPRASVEERLAPSTPQMTDSELATRLATIFQRKGRYRVVRQSEHLLEARIEELRGEVIDGDRRRWERLQLTLVTTPTDDGLLRVVLVLDGQYAPGIGPHAPERRSYRDMETDYAEQLSTYTRALLNRLVEAERTQVRGSVSQ
jgi:hypothetical protein